MPTYSQQIEDKIWALLEGRSQLAALVLAGNRAKQDGPGWLRDRVARAPNDFPRITVSLARFTNTGFEARAFFGMEDGSFPGASAGQIEHRREYWQVIITNKDLVTTTIDRIEHESQAAFASDARCNWGLSFLLMWSPENDPITATRREVTFNGARRLQSTITIPMLLELRGGTAIVAAS